MIERNEGKNMKKFCLLIVSLLVFTGCSSSADEAKKVTCELDSGASQINEKVKITYDGDKKITKIVKTKDAALMDFYFEDYESIEELEKAFEADYINEKKEQPGMEFDISVDEEEKMLHVKITIDPDKAEEIDMERLGIEDYNDLEKLVKNLQGDDYTCGEIE